MLDPADLSQWFEAYAPPLVLYARQWLARGGAEDAVQEAFVRLMLQPVAPRNVRAWLYKAVRNEAISRARSEKRRDEREQRRASPERWFDTSPVDVIDAAAAQAALDQLPPAQREVIVMRVWGGMTLAEIAGVTDSPVSTVFDHYQAGLRAVREKMGVSCETKDD
jgi:RNA polymerase sigma factor (sigma-70 family)